MDLRRPALRGLALLLALPLASVWTFGGSGAPRPPSSGRALARVQVLGFRSVREPRPGPAHRVSARSSRSHRRVSSPLYIGTDGVRVTSQRLQAYLARHGSPLAFHAASLVRAGMAYRVDPRVVVAISGVESSFGVYRRGFNAWGYGRYRWSSWEEAITEYTRMIAGNYPAMRNGDFGAVAQRYDPPNPTAWARHCSTYFQAI